MKVHGVKTDRVAEAVYLGDIIREDGKNHSNIKNRAKKGLGIVSKIMNILETITYGSKYFEIAATLRQAMLINGMLTNAEVWYGLNKSQMDELEEVDKLLIRQTRLITMRSKPDYVEAVLLKLLMLFLML